MEMSPDSESEPEAGSVNACQAFRVGLSIRGEGMRCLCDHECTDRAQAQAVRFLVSAAALSDLPNDGLKRAVVALLCSYHANTYIAIKYVMKCTVATCV